MMLENMLLSGGNDSETMAGEERELEEGVMPLDAQPFLFLFDCILGLIVLETSEKFVFGFQRSHLSVLKK